MCYFKREKTRKEQIDKAIRAGGESEYESKWETEENEGKRQGKEEHFIEKKRGIGRTAQGKEEGLVFALSKWGSYAPLNCLQD